jgi:hypothetical protein
MVPADPELSGDLGHAERVAADLADRPRTGPFGEHRPRPDHARGLTPRPAVALRLFAAPDPLAPHQHRRPARDRHVADRGAGTTLGPGTHPTGAADVAVGRGLDQQHELVPVGRGGDDSEPLESEKQAGQSGNLVHACGLRDGVLDTAIFVRPQARSKHLTPRYRLTRPLVHREEPAFLRHNRRLPLVAPTADGAFVLALGQLVPGV